MYEPRSSQLCRGQRTQPERRTIHGFGPEPAVGRVTGLGRLHVYIEHHGDLLDHQYGRRHDSHRPLVSERSGNEPSPRHAAFPDWGGGEALNATG